MGHQSALVAAGCHGLLVCDKLGHSTPFAAVTSAGCFKIVLHNRLKPPSSSLQLDIGAPIVLKLFFNACQAPLPSLLVIGTTFANLLKMSITTRTDLGLPFFFGISTSGSLVKGVISIMSKRKHFSQTVRYMHLTPVSCNLLRHKLCTSTFFIDGPFSFACFSVSPIEPKPLFCVAYDLLFCQCSCHILFEVEYLTLNE